LDFTVDELRLLSELAKGERTISGNRDRSGMKRLVAGVYVTETSAGPSTTIYALTPKGREVLKSAK
jgi:DNA-binding PadR family transcriptional regulator